MIGDKLLKEPHSPKDYNECIQILIMFGIKLTGHADHIFATALNLVRMNNEVYDKLHCDKE